MITNRSEAIRVIRNEIKRLNELQYHAKRTRRTVHRLPDQDFHENEFTRLAEPSDTTVIWQHRAIHVTQHLLLLHWLKGHEGETHHGYVIQYQTWWESRYGIPENIPWPVRDEVPA